jgi:hypothetical protein
MRMEPMRPRTMQQRANRGVFGLTIDAIFDDRANAAQQE